MNITSVSFLLFALAAIVLHGVAARLRMPALRDLALLAANLYFLSTFAVGGWNGLLPMACFLALGYAGMRLLHVKQGNARLAAAVLALTLAYFFWVKKYAFIPGVLLLPHIYMTIGLSYMFFRILQLQIDAASGNVQQCPGAVAYLNYLLSFTTLISGPIQRYEDFAAYRSAPLPMTWFAFGRALERIAVGAFKVMVAAALLFAWHKQGLIALQVHASLIDKAVNGTAVISGYTLYLYCNFSGYTDIVIGVARFFGNVLPENFERPFAALNFMDFWARWHMTLSNWLKTYVYNPLVKRTMLRFPSPAVDPYIGVFAFLVTFFLIGLWHGQTFVFALYGLLLGVGVSGNKLYQVFMTKRLGRKEYRARAAHWLYQACARGITFTYFCLSLVCFWASWPQIVDLCGKLGWSGMGAVTAAIFGAATVLFECWERLRSLALTPAAAGRPLLLSRYVRTAWFTILVCATAAVTALSATPAPDIVYKNF
ncbi:MAG: hypothetical protein JO269_07420 [Burkholderiaceae bacterium]|nr:hypothetical protein [Burkholderiaceae bacterium]